MAPGLEAWVYSKLHQPFKNSLLAMFLYVFSMLKTENSLKDPLQAYFLSDNIKDTQNKEILSGCRFVVKVCLCSFER